MKTSQKIVFLSPSTRSDKKYMVQFDDKTIHFGAKGMSDFTKHKDKSRKERYENRHKVNENWNDINTAGFWAKNILWNKSSLSESIRDTEKKFSLKIINSKF